MQTGFKLYKVDMKYIRNLHNIDDKVLSVSPQAGKDNRVFIGIVIVCGSHKYCIPLSSPKEKHKKMKNSMDFSKIEINGKLLGVLNFNLMIPIEDEQVRHVDTTIFKRDRENIRYYKKEGHKINLSLCCINNIHFLREINNGKGNCNHNLLCTFNAIDRLRENACI